MNSCMNSWPASQLISMYLDSLNWWIKNRLHSSVKVSSQFRDGRGTEWKIRDCPGWSRAYDIVSQDNSTIGAVVRNTVSPPLTLDLESGWVGVSGPDSCVVVVVAVRYNNYVVRSVSEATYSNSIVKPFKTFLVYYVAVYNIRWTVNCLLLARVFKTNHWPN